MTSSTSRDVEPNVWYHVGFTLHGGVAEEGGAVLFLNGACCGVFLPNDYFDCWRRHPSRPLAVLLTHHVYHRASRNCAVMSHSSCLARVLVLRCRSAKRLSLLAVTTVGRTVTDGR